MTRLYIIKIGGNVIDHQEQLTTFLDAFHKLEGLKILVHGGGKIASELGSKMGIEARMHNGRRITDAETMKLVTMVYGGLINKNIVARLQAAGCNAIGLTGADANILPAHKRAVKDIDYGYAGDVDDNINASSLSLLIDNGLVPVLAPLTHDGKGNMLNTNADTIAAAVATALAPKYDVELVYCFEKTGVMRDVADKTSVIPSISLTEYGLLKEQGIITDGMLPKLDNAFAALVKGVHSVRIMHAQYLSHISENETAVGTLLYA